MLQVVLARRAESRQSPRLTQRTHPPLHCALVSTEARVHCVCAALFSLGRVPCVYPVCAAGKPLVRSKAGGAPPELPSAVRERLLPGGGLGIWPAGSHSARTPHCTLCTLLTVVCALCVVQVRLGRGRGGRRADAVLLAMITC